MPRKLPKNVHKERNRHGADVFYFRWKHGERVRLPSPDSPGFETSLAAARACRPILHVRDMPKTAAATRKQRVEVALKRALISARSRAAKKGVPFDLTVEWLLAEAEKKDFRCALTGIEFYAKSNTTGRIDPYIPSLDRIKPRLGYVPGNVRIVTRAVNTMLLDWGSEIFEQVVNSYRYWQRNEKRNSIPVLSNTLPRTTGIAQ